jgi:hypothetical protein
MTLLAGKSENEQSGNSNISSIAIALRTQLTIPFQADGVPSGRLPESLVHPAPEVGAGGTATKYDGPHFRGGNQAMGIESVSKEQRILRVLRTVLGNIVKETAPRPGVPRPLSDQTVADIRDLFGLIAEREAELADEAGLDRKERPHFTDEPRSTHAVKIHRPPKKPN